MPLQRTWEVVRIELSTPGEWIEVKAKMGKDDERRRSSLMLRGQVLDPAELAAGIQRFDAGAMVAEAPFATLITVAKDWNLVDPETGRKAPLTEANLRAISDEDLAILTAKFEELYPPELTEKQAKNS